MHTKSQKNRSHNKIKKIKCFKKENQSTIYCPFLFLIGPISQSSLRESNTTLRCKDCNLVFADSRSFTSHNLRIHGYRAYCYHCSKPFKSQLGYNYHNNMKHGSGSELFSCLICGKKFQSPSLVKRHMACHSENRPFVCHVCHRGFRFKTNLTAHMKLHTSQISYSSHIMHHLLFIGVPCGVFFLCKKKLHQHFMLHVKYGCKKNLSNLEGFFPKNNVFFNYILCK